MATIKLNQITDGAISKLKQGANNNSSAAATVKAAANEISSMDFSAKQSIQNELSKIQKNLNRSSSFATELAGSIQKAQNELISEDKRSNKNEGGFIPIIKPSRWDISEATRALSASSYVKLGMTAGITGMFCKRGSSTNVRASNFREIMQRIVNFFKNKWSKSTGSTGNKNNSVSNGPSGSTGNKINSVSNEPSYVIDSSNEIEVIEKEMRNPHKHTQWNVVKNGTSSYSCFAFANRKLEMRGLKGKPVQYGQATYDEWLKSGNRSNNFAKTAPDYIKYLVEKNGGEPLYNIYLEGATGKDGRDGLGSHTALIDKAWIDEKGELRMILSENKDTDHGTFPVAKNPDGVKNSYPLKRQKEYTASEAAKMWVNAYRPLKVKVYGK